MTFALLIGFGYFNVSFDDLAFTQPAPPYRYLTAESFDLPSPKTIDGFVFMYGTIPLQTMTVTYMPTEPPNDLFSWIPTAEATTVTVQGPIGTLSVGGLAQSTCGPNSNFGGVSTLFVQNRASASTSGCLLTTFLLEPVPPHELGPFITSVGAGARKTSGQVNHVCGFVINNGVPSFFGGPQTPAEANDNATNNSFLGGNLNCQVAGQVSGLKTGVSTLANDLEARLLAGVNPDGTDIDDGYPYLYSYNGYPFRAGVNRFFFATFMFETFDVDIPVNKTDGIWQFKEHSKYESGLMSDCNLQRVGDVLRLDSGTLDSHQGQCMMFKVFNKTEVGTPDVSATVIATGTGSSEMRVFVDVKDGIYDMETGYNNVGTDIVMVPDANNQWTENQLEDDLGTGTNHRFGIVEVDSPFTGTIEVSPEYVLGSEDFFTVFVGIQDNSTDGSVTLDITNIKVGTDEYDFDIPDVRFYEHTRTQTTSNELFPELDVGFIDGNYTVGAGVTAPVLPTPPGLVENVNATAIASIELDWTHDGINTTGYRIYRTSTEAVDEVIEYTFSGTLNPQAIAVNQSPRDFAVESTWADARFRDEIISRITINKMDQSSATGGDVQGVIVANTIGTDDTIIANSTTKIDPATLPTFGPVFDGSAQTFRFRDTDLVNLTTANMPSTTNAGFGLVWNNPGSGSVVVQTRDRGDGSSPRALRLDVGSGWAGVGGQDLIASIASINQTKLFFDPFINDTGSLDTNFTDSSTLTGHSYFFRIVPMNGLVEGNTIEIVNATEPEIPQQATGLAGIFNETSQTIELSWDDIGANSYNIFRTSTELGDTEIFQSTGLSGTGGVLIDEPIIDHISQTRYLSNDLTGNIITDTRFRVTDNADDAVGGFVQGALFVESQTASLDDTTLKNSTSTRNISEFTGTPSNPIFYYRGTDLLNFTETLNHGIGISWVGRTSGNLAVRSDNTLDGNSEQSRWDAFGPNWARTNGEDYRLLINQLNQTKLSETFLQTSATTFSDSNVDTSLVVGNTYFYRITGENILGQQGAFSAIINITAVNATLIIPDPVTNFTITNDNVNREIDISFDPSLNADSYIVERLSTEREITKFDSTVGDINLVGVLSQAPDRGGDSVGFLEGEILTKLNSAIFRKNSDAVGGKIETGIWFNLVSGVSTKVDLDVKAEYSHGSEWYASNMGAGERPNRSCVGDTAQFRQDGMTPLTNGFYFDGLCRDQAIFRGNQLHNLTSADIAATEVVGRLWDNDGNVNDLPSGDGSILLSEVSGGSHWNWNGAVWLTTGTNLQQRVWILNQTAVEIITLQGNLNTTFSDKVLEEHGYFYRIIPVNSGNQGNATIYLNQTLSLPPDHVPDLNATDNGSSVDLVWAEAQIKPSRTDSGDPIQGYLVQRAGENETRIHDGYGRDFATLRDHPDRTAGDILTGGFSEAYGQQLNFTSPENVTRFVALISHTGNAQGNVEPTIQGAIWNVTDGVLLALSQNPKMSWNDDRIASATGRYVNVIFDPPIVLPIGEYVFGFIHNGLTCSGSCFSSPFLSGFANQELTPRYNNTNNGDADGFAMFARSGNFPNEQINGTNADLAISIYTEGNWTTIGQTNANTFTFTDNSPPPVTETKSYRVLPFNDFGIADPPVLAHDPFKETINGTLAGDADGVQGFSHGSSQKPPFVDGTFGKLNIGEIVTFTVPLVTGTVPNAPTGLDAIADLVDINLDWDAQGTADSFSVFRNGSSIATGVLVSEFTDLSVAIGEFFSYTVTAVNVNGSSAASTPSIVLSNDVPSIVTGAGAMPINGVAILVEWDDPVADRGEGSPSTGLNVEYLVFRNDTGDANPFVFVGTVPEGINFLNDTTVLGGHSFSYKILSSNEIGNATANSTVTAPVMVDNALVIRALEADGIASLEEDAEITIFNSTFNSGPLTANAQGRVFLFNATGAYNFTIFYTAQNIDFLVNKTLTGVTGVILTEDTVVNVNTNVFKVDCASNGPAKDFKVLVNSTSDDHFISNFTTPVCDVNDKVSWQVQYTSIGGSGGGGSETAIANLVSNTYENVDQLDVLAISGAGNFEGFAGNIYDNEENPIYTNPVKITGIYANIGSVVISGTMSMIIATNASAGSNPSDMVIVAVSDESIDLSNFPQVPSLPNAINDETDRPVLWNFTSQPEITFTADTFIGFNFTDVVATAGNNAIGIEAWENGGGFGNGQCYIANTTASETFAGCSLAILGYEINVLVENVDDWETTSGIEVGKLVVHHSFDDAQLYDSGEDKALYRNAGTLQERADASALIETGTQGKDDSSATGLLGEAFFMSEPTIGNDEGYMTIGFSDYDRVQDFNFINDDVTDTFSINVWVRGNWTTQSAEFIPIIGNLYSGISSGFSLGITSSGEASLDIISNELPVIGSANTTGTVNDDDWGMLTLIVEKSNATNTVQLCLDAVCEGIDRASPYEEYAVISNKLIVADTNINNYDDVSLGKSVPISILIDELCIWKDYKLTSSDLSTLHNSGNGASCGTVTQTSSGGGSGTSDFTTTMATQVLSLGDFGNNAKNFIVNGTMLNTTFSSPVITSEDIVVSTNSSDVLLVFEELFLQEEETIPPGNTPGSPPPTQTAGGGGLPRLDITTELQFFEDLFGFSLFSKIHQLQVGQTQDGTIDITWNSPSPITITGIQVGDQFITWVGFPKTPFVIEGNDRISTGKIPYRIMPPNNLCDEVTGQTANCVDRILYEIPVKIFAAVEGQPIEANTVIKVNLSLDITLALFTVFIAFVAGVGAIVYRAAIITPRQRRVSKKELKTKGKERQQIENRFSARKSKLRRRP